LVAGLAVALMAVAGGGSWFVRGQERQVRQGVEEGLLSIADSKVKQLAQWRAERQCDAAMLQEDPVFHSELSRWMAEQGAEVRGLILARFRSLQKNYRFTDVALVDPQGQVRMSLSGCEAAQPGAAEGNSRAAWESREPKFTDLHIAPGGGTPQVDLVVPFFAGADGSGEPLALVVFEIDARQFLYQVTQSWPTPSATAETLFVRRDGDAVLYLNELRFLSGAALKLRIGLDRVDVPAVMAVLGREGVVDGLDYRGVLVIAALRAIPDSPWFMAAKMDAQEAFSEWRLHVTLIVAVLGLLWLALAGALVMVWQQWARYQALANSAAALRERQGRLNDALGLNEKLLGAATVGILTYDACGHCVLANEAAARAVGDTLAALLAQNLREVAAWERSGLLQAGEQVLATGELQRREFALVTKLQSNCVLDCTLVRFESGGRPHLLLIVDDITERKRALEALALSQQRLHLAVETAGIGIWDWDIRRDTITWDAQMYRFYGMQPGADLHIAFQQWADVVHPADLPEQLRILHALACNGGRSEREFRIRRLGDLETRHIQAAEICVADAAGRPVRVVGVNIDITQSKLMEARQRRLLDELSRSNTDLEQFAYVASHDLKSPLRAINSLAGWLQEDLESVLTGDSRKHLELLRQRTHRMERLLDDLLAYSRAGRVPADIVGVDVARLVAEIVEMVNPPAGFTVRLEPPSPVFETAVTPLRQVLTNLIANAIKHHDRPAGVVEVVVREAGEWWEFTVADDGPGIAPEFHERIFGMFQTLRPRDEVEGSGIGLALVRRIVARYGGAATVACREPRGSVFRFKWPQIMLTDESFPA
jgi:PAS domain S-box-containing protein